MEQFDRQALPAPGVWSSPTFLMHAGAAARIGLTPLQDRFAEALDEAQAAIANGEPANEVLREIVGDHGLDVDALRRRSERAFGDLATLEQRKAREREWTTEQEAWARRSILLKQFADSDGNNSPQYKAELSRQFFNTSSVGDYYYDRYRRVFDEDD